MGGTSSSSRRSTQLLLPPPPPPPPSESLASLPENVLAEIFLNLDTHPANLRSVSLGSHQFRDIVTNRPFLRRFRAHHGDVAPLVGFFRDEIPRFLPTPGGSLARSKSGRAIPGAGALEPRDANWLIQSTRHGRILLQSPDRRRVLVLDPMVGRRQYIDIPPWYRPKYLSTAAVICDPGAAGHGDCRSNAFRFVFVYFRNIFQTLMAIYSSEEDSWTKVEFQEKAPRAAVEVTRPCIQVGDVMYWQSVLTLILAFNVSTHELHEIPLPVDLRGNDYVARSNTYVVAPKDSSLGFIYITLHNLQLWVSNFNNGVHVEWIPLRTVILDSLLPIRGTRPLTHTLWMAQRPVVRIIGYDEDENVVYLWTKVGVFGLQLDTMQSTKLLGSYGWIQKVFPYKSFFITGEVECAEQRGRAHQDSGDGGPFQQSTAIAAAG